MSVLKLYPKHPSKHSLWISVYNLHSKSQRICLSNLRIKIPRKFLPCACHIYFYFVNFSTHFFYQDHHWVNSFLYINKKESIWQSVCFPFPSIWSWVAFEKWLSRKCLGNSCFQTWPFFKNEDMFINISTLDSTLQFYRGRTTHKASAGFESFKWSRSHSWTGNIISI